MACWITFFADGARRNSSLSVLYSRLGDASFLGVDGMMTLFRFMYGKTTCVTRVMALDPPNGARPPKTAVSSSPYAASFVRSLPRARSRLRLGRSEPVRGEVACSSASLSRPKGSGWVSSHSLRAVLVGLILSLLHHAASSPQR